MLAGLAVQYACIAASGTYNQACSKATDAFLKQSGIEHNLSLVERYGKVRAKDMATGAIGTPNMKLIASGYYVYHLYQVQTITLPVPTLGLANSANTTLTPNSVSMGVSWSIR